MTKFTKKPKVEIIEAVAFYNDEKTNAEISDLAGDQMEQSSVDDNEILTIYLKKEKEEDEPKTLVLNHSDWLIKDEDGVLSVMDPFNFNEEFDLLRE
jgi:hypothetical protein